MQLLRFHLVEDESCEREIKQELEKISGAPITDDALRNAIIPVIAFLGVTAAELVAGSIVVEQVFAVPGLGQLLLSSIGSRDFPVAQAVVILLATWVVVVNFIADVLYQYMDPRIRIR